MYEQTRHHVKAALHDAAAIAIGPAVIGMLIAIEAYWPDAIDQLVPSGLMMLGCSLAYAAPKWMLARRPDFDRHGAAALALCVLFAGWIIDAAGVMTWPHRHLHLVDGILAGLCAAAGIGVGLRSSRQSRRTTQ